MIAHHIINFLLILTPFLHSDITQPEPILLQNPSFEGTPGFSRLPYGWFYCGEMGESPPDVHPSGNFGVEQAPQHGSTYIGMVVRDNNTQEGVSQWLNEPLITGQCYEFSLYAARSPRYQSVSRTTWQPTNFDKPVRLLIWAGFYNCEKVELLATTSLIEHTDWQHYIFQIQGSQAYNRLLIEAQYAEGEMPYCGNVLIDHASPLLPIDCNNHQLLAPIETFHIKAPINIIESKDIITRLIEKVHFSEIDQRPEQHLFFLPSGELQQCNRYLYNIAQIVQRFPDIKLFFYINERNKHHLQNKMLALETELMLVGLSPERFRIQKNNARESDTTSEISLKIK
ncbi:MAG: hypothetical protein SFU99_03010 [Saprospiraceae bacterium]|nr:hypothetical protein [Saprospiraceae bacterium]